MLDVWRKLKPQNMITRRMTECRICFHHTASNPNATPDDIAKAHRERGWSHIGYHYLIYEDGRVYKTLPINVQPICVANQNRDMVCIAFVGNYNDKPLTPIQIEKAKWLVHVLNMIYKVKEVKGHRDYSNTQCPGTRAYTMLKTQGVIK